MSETKSVQATGSGVGGLLGVLFVGLKLTGYIDWSWWLVLLPFYAWVVVLLGILVLGGIVMGVIGVTQAIHNRRRERARVIRDVERRFR